MNESGNVIRFGEPLAWTKVQPMNEVGSIIEDSKPLAWQETSFCNDQIAWCCVVTLFSLQAAFCS